MTPEGYRPPNEQVPRPIPMDNLFEADSDLARRRADLRSSRSGINPTASGDSLSYYSADDSSSVFSNDVFSLGISTPDTYFSPPDLDFQEDFEGDDDKFVDDLDRLLNATSAQTSTYDVTEIKYVTAECGGSSDQCSATFNAHWELGDFIRDQLENCVDDLPLTMTLTGSADAAVAMTCQEYISQNWPEIGELLVGCIMEWLGILLKGQMSEQDCARGLRVNASETRIEIFGSLNSPTFVVSGNIRTVEQAGAVLCWLTATFRLPYAGTPRYSASYLFKRGPRIHVSLHEQKQIMVEESTTTCWMALFHRMNIAQNFPIPDRQDTGLADFGLRGLELSFELMVALAGIQYPLPFEDSILLRGASSVLTPIHRSQSAVYWHLEVTEDKQKFLSIDKLVTKYVPRSQGCKIDPKGFAQLTAARQFLGYCSEANVLLGTASSGYDHITSCGADNEGSDIQFTGFSAGAGTEGMGIFGGSFTASFRLAKGARVNIREMPFSDFERLAKAAHECSLIYDVRAQRGWLVPELSLLMHCLSTWASERGLVSQFPFARVDPDGGDAAFDAIFGSKDATFDLHGEKITWKSRVMLFLNLLQQRKEAAYIRDHGSTQFPSIGVLRKLRGWDYQELIQFRDFPMRKSIKIHDSPAWCHALQRHPDILVLLCNGLMAPIVPRRNAQVCFAGSNAPNWRSSLIATNRCAAKIGAELSFNHKMFMSSPSFFYHFSATNPSALAEKVEKRRDIALYFESHPDGAIIFCDKDAIKP